MPALTSGDGTSVHEDPEGCARARRASSKLEGAANEVPYLDGRMSGSKTADCETVEGCRGRDVRNPTRVRSLGFEVLWPLGNDGGVSEPY